MNHETETITPTKWNDRSEWSDMAPDYRLVSYFAQRFAEMKPTQQCSATTNHSTTWKSYSYITYTHLIRSLWVNCLPSDAFLHLTNTLPNGIIVLYLIDQFIYLIDTSLTLSTSNYSAGNVYKFISFGGEHVKYILSVGIISHPALSADICSPFAHFNIQCNTLVLHFPFSKPSKSKRIQ